MRWFLSILAVLLIVPGWTGEARLPLIEQDSVLVARPVRVAPAQRLVGALRFVAGLDLSSPSPGFTGFSALAIRGGRVVMLSDGGNWVSFAIRRGRPAEARGGFLPDGPATGWQKMDRDSESLAFDPATGAAWVGFERANAIWRYSPFLARAEARAAPPAMRRWRINGGPEALVRLADGRFVTIAEEAKRRSPALRMMLVFPRDPTVPGTRPFMASYQPPAGFNPSDAAQLPDGDLLILNRRWRPPLAFAAALVRVKLSALKPGVIVRGERIATLAAPLVNENFEGLAVTREAGGTRLWLLTDNDLPPFQRTLLLKFALE